MNKLKELVGATGSVPLSFVQGRAVANLGDVLSPVMVTLLSGLPCRHVAQNSSELRMGAVGTIAQGFEGGEVWLWGTGTSKYANPLEKGHRKRLFVPNDAAMFRVTATRGPVSRRILGEENATGAPAFGDPVWLLPQFYNPKPKKRWKLGVIVHLADLDGRSLDATAKALYRRYDIPPSEQSSVRLLNTLTEPNADAMRMRLDEILECERLVSTSLHGMVFAESYGIPCLYFSPRGKSGRLTEVDLTDEDSLDLRVIDLYRGLGRTKLPVYVQARRRPTDWDHLMRTIDEVWEPIAFDTGPLVEAFPLDVAPLSAPQGRTIFDHPLVHAAPIGRQSLLDVPPLANPQALVDRLKFWKP